MLAALRDLWQNRKIEILFIATGVLFVVVATTIGLSDDEAYYWSWSLKPDLSYFDHPPLLAWTIWLTTHLFGKTLFAVRLPALLCFWAMTFLTVDWMKRFGISSRNAVALAISSPLFFVFGWMALPDVIFLPLALFSVRFALDRKYFGAGLVLGLSVLAKWHGLLLMPAFLVMIALQELDWKKRVEALSKVYPIAFLLQAPVLYWNSQHQWISFHYHLVERQKSFGNFAQSVERGAGFVLGFILIGGLSFMYLVYAHFKSRKLNPNLDREDRILLALALPYLAIFGFSAIKGETRIYWTGFALFPLAIFFLRHLPLREQRKFQSISICASALSAVILVLVLYAPIGTYFQSAIEAFRPYDIRFSPRGGFTGWKEWADQQIAEENGQESHVLYLGADFRQASQLLWNSNLRFDQVSAAEPSHQLLIWPVPDRRLFSKIVVFGDNNRGLSDYKWSLVCTEPRPKMDYFSVQIFSRTVKVIEDVACTHMVMNEGR